MNQEMIDQARAVLRQNDLGHYTVPTHGLYPFQWNWDSALTSIGFGRFDEARAWTELRTLFENQWPTGLVPHIIFHKEDDGYYPGPSVWGTDRIPRTSGITQPPVAGFAMRTLFDRAQNRAEAKYQARELLPKIHAWHQWFYRARDPDSTGLVAIIHPWESGRDNSVDWDEAFARVPTDGVEPFQRRDTQHANPDHRPTNEQYKRYIWLVQLFRSLGWDDEQLHNASPFRIVDPGFNAILIRSCLDLATVAEQLGEYEVAQQSQEYAKRGLAALETLWSDEHDQYLCFDRASGTPVQSLSISGLLAVFAPIPSVHANGIARRISRIGEQVDCLIPSHDPASPDFDPRRYWRGPVWLIINYMIADGLQQSSHHALARRIIDDSLELIQSSGFAEYYDPQDRTPCGGSHFTWTAAMVIEFLSSFG